MSKKPKPILPASRRAIRDITGGAPGAKRSTPTGSKPGRIGSGRSPMAKGLFVPPDKSSERKGRKR